ncbi:MAG TPA: hypothetical protein G4O08_07945 [Anaerolineae bacterium]|nr:hypothetical protein [Anaerolineae bacterium]
MYSRWNRNWTKAMAFAVIILATLACSTSSLFGPTPTPVIREVTRVVEIPVTRVVTAPPSEPPINLAGQWYNTTTTTMTTIIWTGYEFMVASMYDTEDREIRPVTLSEWDGTRIKWSYYLAANDLTITYTMTSLVGDRLNCEWTNTAGSSGTRTLDRE